MDIFLVLVFFCWNFQIVKNGHFFSGWGGAHLGQRLYEIWFHFLKENSLEIIINYTPDIVPPGFTPWGC